MIRLQNRRVDNQHRQWWSLRRWHGHADLWRGDVPYGVLCAGPYLTRGGAARALERAARRLAGAS